MLVVRGGWGSPKVTKDGVTVAEDIELDDPYENLGAKVASRKPPARPTTSPATGDGTTTATVLAEAIFREGLKMIAAGADPMALSRGIQQGTSKPMIAAIAKMADADRRQEQERASAGRHDRRQQRSVDRQGSR